MGVFIFFFSKWKLFNVPNFKFIRLVKNPYTFESVSEWEKFVIFWDLYLGNDLRFKFEIIQCQNKIILNNISHFDFNSLLGSVVMKVGNKPQVCSYTIIRQQCILKSFNLLIYTLKFLPDFNRAFFFKLSFSKTFFFFFMMCR